jgi:hypothetical protein
LITIEDDITVTHELAGYKWYSRRIGLALSGRIRVSALRIPLRVREHVGLFMAIVASRTGWRFRQRRSAGRRFCGAIMVHGAHGFARALEEAQKLSLGKTFSSLGICVYHVL